MGEQRLLQRVLGEAGAEAGVYQEGMRPGGEGGAQVAGAVADEDGAGEIAAPLLGGAQQHLRGRFTAAAGGGRGCGQM